MYTVYYTYIIAKRFAGGGEGGGKEEFKSVVVYMNIYI